MLEVVGVDSPDEKTKQLPAQFRTRYRLTEKGEYAAEYGMYDRQVMPNNAHNQSTQPEKINRKRRGL